MIPWDIIKAYRLSYTIRYDKISGKTDNLTILLLSLQLETKVTNNEEVCSYRLTMLCIDDKQR